MTVLNSELDECVAPGFTGGPEFSTQIVSLRNGAERRNGNWIYARHRYTASYGSLTRARYVAIRQMFLSCQGMLRGFLFRDPGDYSATAESIGNAPSGSTPVQLYKSSTVDSVTYTRIITRPESVGFTLYQNGIAKAGTLNTSTGYFTPTTAWTAGQPLTWTGTFLVPVRFASDWLPMTFDGLEDVDGSVELLELIGE